MQNGHSVLAALRAFKGGGLADKPALVALARLIDAGRGLETGPVAEIELSPDAQDAIDRLTRKNIADARAIGRGEEPTMPKPTAADERGICAREGCSNTFARNKSGKPRKFCSDKCRAAQYAGSPAPAPRRAPARRTTRERPPARVARTPAIGAPNGHVGETIRALDARIAELQRTRDALVAAFPEHER